MHTTCTLARTIKSYYPYDNRNAQITHLFLLLALLLILELVITGKQQNGLQGLKPTDNNNLMQTGNNLVLLKTNLHAGHTLEGSTT